jgi:hypothetical protein
VTARPAHGKAQAPVSGHLLMLVRVSSMRHAAALGQPLEITAIGRISAQEFLRKSGKIVWRRRVVAGLRRRRGRVDACLRRDRHRHSFRQVGCIMMGTQARAYPQMPGAPSIFLRMCVDDTGDRTSGGRTPGGRTPEVRQGRSPPGSAWSACRMLYPASALKSVGLGGLVGLFDWDRQAPHPSRMRGRFLRITRRGSR